MNYSVVLYLILLSLTHDIIGVAKIFLMMMNVVHTQSKTK